MQHFIISIIILIVFCLGQRALLSYLLLIIKYLYTKTSIVRCLFIWNSSLSTMNDIKHYYKCTVIIFLNAFNTELNSKVMRVLHSAVSGIFLENL